MMNVVFIVPTGIGAEIGGHSGDATPAAKLIASVCDTLFIHPNVVNASDTNEMTDNMLYVEGSILDGFLEGFYGLSKVSMNKILVAVNEITTNVINAVSGARATIGAEIDIIELEKPIKMTASMTNGKASGSLSNIENVLNQIHAQRPFDVLVVNTPIDVDASAVKKYLGEDGGTNVWGGVEALLSKEMSQRLKLPVIHAPVENGESFNGVVDPRKAMEMVSVCYLHCCLKGAHKAPKISDKPNAFWRTDLDFLVSPIDVFGRPHIACMDAKIPIIFVEENKTVLKDNMHGYGVIAKTYLEAAGIICAKKAGVSIASIRRPLPKTVVIK